MFHIERCIHVKYSIVGKHHELMSFVPKTRFPIFSISVIFPPSSNRFEHHDRDFPSTAALLISLVSRIVIKCQLPVIIPLRLVSDPGIVIACLTINTQLNSRISPQIMVPSWVVDAAQA